MKNETMIPIEKNTREDLKQICKHEGRTYNGQIRRFIENYWDTT